MSAKLLGWAYRQKTGSCITKAVLIKLVDNANDNGYAHPSMSQLITDLELSERAARDHIKRLEEIGLLKVIREKIAEKVNMPNRYQLLIQATSTLGETEKRTPVAQYAVPPPATCPTMEQDVHEGVLQEVQTVPLSSSPQESPQGPLSTAVAVLGEPSEVDLAVQAFNQAAETCPKWAECRQVTRARRAAISARLKEVGLAGWRRTVDLAAGSGHLGGPIPTSGTHQGWRMDIAWFAKAEHFARISEGGYAASRQDAPRGLASAAEGMRDFFEGRAR